MLHVMVLVHTNNWFVFILFGGEGGVYRGGCGGGPVQIACSGVKLNDGSTELVVTVVNEGSNQPAVHLAIIQACFSLSSQVLLVS